MTQRRSEGVPAPAERGTARIAVDLLGGDEAPAVVVDGALHACGADPDLHLLLVGPPEVADEVIGALAPAERPRVAVRSVHGAVGMAEAPTRASRPDTTVRAAVAAVAEGRADAVVSAGATGATVTAAVLGLGRMPGVRRPALAATLPALAGPVVLLDVGASVEASAAVLLRHAAIGAAYAIVLHDVAAPRVGLLSVGTEEGKGDRARRAAAAALAESRLPAGARYVGLVEGYDVSLGDRADVVVTDGFTGNVLLKGVEGAYALAGGVPPGGRAPRAAALLGVAGIAVVCHGAASGEDLASGIALAARLHRRAATAALSALIKDFAELAGETEGRTP
ncbi:MAG TPA: phosphate acyltransferase PlsX [Micromonosporaceae bacterium]|nr:phosphate acyltransferase PlsX [Micromonosporaceae bacterium]